VCHVGGTVACKRFPSNSFEGLCDVVLIALRFPLRFQSHVCYLVELGIYQKPTSTDTTIHFSSNHPYEHKLAAFNYYINILLTLSITKESKQQEWKTILTIACNNAFPTHIIHNLKKKLKAKKQQQQ
jgi:hypothetical protein